MNLIDSILDSISETEQRETDIKMIIAAMISDKIGTSEDKVLLSEFVETLEITYRDALHLVSGNHCFSLSEIIKIESFLGVKIINL